MSAEELTHRLAAALASESSKLTDALLALVLIRDTPRGSDEMRRIAGDALNNLKALSR